jgi:flagellar hook-associated protein 1 FlgK
MPSPFQGIETASRALLAFQRSLDTTGHNIANVNTAGYSRQVVKLEATSPDTSWGTGGMISIGSGVAVNSINRIRDAMLESRRQDAYSEHGRSEGSLSNLEKVQSTFLDVQGSGISTALSTFYNSFSALGSNPTSAASQLQVQSAGRDLTQKISSTYGQLKNQEASQTDQINQTISDIQGLGDSIAKINVEIRKQVASGGSPNDLLDQRDQAISDLSKLVNVDTHASNDGTMSVYVGNFTLVDQVGSTKFPTAFNAGSSTVTDANATWSITSGKLKGLFDNANQVASYKGQLDNLANTLRTQVNALHSAGFTSTGATGQNFFNDSNPQTGAVDFALDAAVDASPSNIAIGNSSAAGDGSAALAISAIRDSKIASLGNRTSEAFYGDLTSTVGRDVSVAKNGVNTANSLSEQIDAQVQDVAGVNLDEEMSHMLQFQRSYQAAAKVLNTMDSIMGDLINIIK